MQHYYESSIYAHGPSLDITCVMVYAIVLPPERNSAGPCSFRTNNATLGLSQYTDTPPPFPFPFNSLPVQQGALLGDGARREQTCVSGARWNCEQLAESRCVQETIAWTIEPTNLNEDENTIGASPSRPLLVQLYAPP